MGTLVQKDRVKETTNTTGTGTWTLAGAVTGFQTFSSTVGDGNTCNYAASDGGSNWEVGVGTYTSAGNTRARTTRHSEVLPPAHDFDMPSLHDQPCRP